MSELAPCPFCGGPADLAVGVHCGPADLGARTWWAKCVTCGVETTSSRERMAAVAAWNRRAPVTPADVLLELANREPGR